MSILHRWNELSISTSPYASSVAIGSHSAVCLIYLQWCFTLNQCFKLGTRQSYWNIVDLSSRFEPKKTSFPVASNSCLLKVINLPLKICRSNGGEVEDEKEIVVGDIATVTVQLMWGSPRVSGSDLMGGDLPPVNVIGFSYGFPIFDMEES